MDRRGSQEKDSEIPLGKGLLLQHRHLIQPEALSKQALEETCRQALELGKPNYSFIKNSIQLIAEDLGVAGYNTAVNDERNKGAFVMGAESMDIERLLSRSQSLAQGKGKGGGK